MSNKIQYISLIRVIATLCVVLFHSYAIYFYNVGLDFKFPFIQVYKWFFLVEERIQMPIFAFISGFLFSIQVSRFGNLESLIRSKAHRLLLPYLVFGTLFYFTYPTSFSKTIVPYSTVGHLWFILMLFWLFPIQYILRKLDFRIQFTIAFLMYLLYVKMPHTLGLSSVCWLFIFFNMAFNWQYFLKYTNHKFNLIVTLVLSLLVILSYEYCINTLGWILMQRVLYLICSYYWISIIMSVSQRFTRESKLLTSLDRSSLGIYIFHNWIMLNVLDTSPIVRGFAVSHYVFYPLLMFLFLVSVSWVITSCFVKIKPLNNLI